MSHVAAPDRRHAFLVRVRPLPTFRVRSASDEPAHLVVVQTDLSLSCNCTAASFHAPSCAHRRIATRSIEWRTGWRLVEGSGWIPRNAADAHRPLLTVLQGGQA